LNGKAIGGVLSPVFFKYSNFVIFFS